MKDRTKIINFIKKRPGLIWWVSDYARLSDDAIVEATLNYGSWDDVQILFKELGIKKTAKIFRKRSAQKRCNYRPEIKNYFTLYFNKYAPQRNIDSGTAKTPASR